MKKDKTLFSHPVIHLIAIFLLYYITGKIGLQLSSHADQVTLIWPPAGIALFALLLGGIRMWPSIWIAAFLINVPLGTSIIGSAFIASGNTLGPVLAVYMLRYLKFDRYFSSSRDVVIYLLVGVFLGMSINATIGVSTLYLENIIPKDAINNVWLTWWLGDSLGALIFGMALLSMAGINHFNSSKSLYSILLDWLVLLIIGTFCLTPLSAALPVSIPAYFIFPFVIWLGLRQSPAHASSAIIFLSFMAIWGVLENQGPFIHQSNQMQLSELWTFLFTIAIVSSFITALRNEAFIALQNTQQSETRFRKLFDENTSIMLRIDSSTGSIVDANASALSFYGYKKSPFIGSSIQQLDVTDEQQIDILEYLNTLTKTSPARTHHKLHSGEIRQVEMHLTDINVEDKKTLYAIIHDVTEREEVQNQLEHSAHHDILTGLPNRSLFGDRLYQAMLQAKRRRLKLAVLYLDLDGFKEVNDNSGHDAGDHVLVEVANRISGILRESDSVARLGGDEFVAIINDLPDTASCTFLVKRILEGLSTPTTFNDLILNISASIGVTFYPQENDVTADQLIRQADQAMYQAKLSGKNRFCFFDTEYDKNVKNRLESLEQISDGLNLDQFVIFYQPKINMLTNEIDGAEALVRWNHPEFGLIAPDNFLPTIKNHSLSLELDRHVLNCVIKQLSIWQQQGIDVQISINIGVHLLQLNDFDQVLIDQLKPYPNISPSCLMMEILETNALKDFDHVSYIINKCKETGISFALDDFGTGYSSLTYLKALSVKQLKIDKSFILNMLHNPEDLTIIKGILNLANAFNLEVIAEGVESQEQSTALIELGCHLGQGYYFSRPLPADEFIKWIKK